MWKYRRKKKTTKITLELFINHNYLTIGRNFSYPQVDPGNSMKLIICLYFIPSVSRGIFFKHKKTPAIAGFENNIDLT
ncbi:hypothetical protein MTBGP_19760 [Moorella thermoacetica]